MIKDIIEYKRHQLYQTVGLSGLTAEETISISEELERYMNFQARLIGTPVPARQASVHSNAIENILTVAEKEKLDLPFEMNNRLLQYAEWFKIDLAHNLLQAIENRYGSEVIEYIGEQVPAVCIFPDNVQSLRDSVRHLNDIFHLNHKSNTYIGEYLPYMDIKNEITLFCHTPYYLTAFNLGIIQGLSKKFNHSLKLKVLDQANGGQFKIVG